MQSIFTTRFKQCIDKNIWIESKWKNLPEKYFFLFFEKDSKHTQNTPSFYFLFEFYTHANIIALCNPKTQKKLPPRIIKIFDFCKNMRKTFVGMPRLRNFIVGWDFWWKTRNTFLLVRLLVALAVKCGI